MIGMVCHMADIKNGRSHGCVCSWDRPKAKEIK